MRNASASATSRKAQTAKRTNKELRCFKPNRSDRLQQLYDDAQAKLLKASLELREKDAMLNVVCRAFDKATARYAGAHELYMIFFKQGLCHKELVQRINAVLAEGAAELNGVRWVKAEKIQEAIGQ